MSRILSSSLSNWRLVVETILLYIVFIYWGYLQEKLTTTPYTSVAHGIIETGSSQIRYWKFPFVLNLSMAVGSVLFSTLWRYLFTRDAKSVVDIRIFYKLAFTSSFASPIGYASLSFISFPMMILAKSSKPVPVMMIGALFYSRQYSLLKYLNVLMLCGGVLLFSLFKESHSAPSRSTEGFDDTWASTAHTWLGVLLVLINITLDGFTNQEQDKIFRTHSIAPYQMMQYSGIWNAFYIMSYLCLNWLVFRNDSEACQAFELLHFSYEARMDLVMFSLLGATGQFLLLGIVKKFGSLMWVTISVTRKIVTVLLSILIFRHQINIWQWVGIFMVFGGLTLEIMHERHAQDSELESHVSSDAHKSRLQESSSGGYSSNRKLKTT
jgi:UDP-galactose transporter B1